MRLAVAAGLRSSVVEYFTGIVEQQVQLLLEGLYTFIVSLKLESKLFVLKTCQSYIIYRLYDTHTRNRHKGLAQPFSRSTIGIYSVGAAALGLSQRAA